MVNLPFHANPSRQSPASGAAAIVAMALLAYIPAMLGCAIWDDDAHVTENLTLRTWEGLRRIWLERGAT